MAGTMTNIGRLSRAAKHQSMSKQNPLVAESMSAHVSERPVPSAPSRRHIALRGLPRTTTPDDVRRLLRRHSIGNVTNVQLEYHNFYPKGTAILTLSGAQHYNGIMDQLQHQPKLYGHTLVAAPTSAPTLNEKSQVLVRDDLPLMIVAGHGAQAGVKEVGRSVYILGLPTGTDARTVRTILETRGFDLWGEQHRNKPSSGVWKVFSPANALSSRFLVKLPSETEAQRLVRELHMTYHHRHLIQARVII